MPSGAKKRKAAKKKQVQHLNHSTTHETDSQDHSSNQHQYTEEDMVEVEKREDKSSESKSGKDGEGSVEIEIGSKSKESHDSSSNSSSSSSDDESDVVEKKVVVLESAAPVSEPVEPVTETISQKVEEPTVVEPVKPLESLLEVSRVYEEKQETPLVDQSSGVVDESGANDNSATSEAVIEPVSKENGDVKAVTAGSGAKSDVADLTLQNEPQTCAASSEVVESVSKENGVVKVESGHEKASLEIKGDVAALTQQKGSVSGVNGADHVNESETCDNSETQPLVAQAPRAAATTSWKGCCGILELFSGSNA